MAKTSFMLLTTSRRPAKNMRTFCRDLSHTFSNIVRVNRGKLSLEGIAEKGLELDAEKAVIVDRWKGGLGKIRFFRISEKGLDAVPPLIYVRGIKLRRDFRENMPKERRIKSVAMASSQKASFKVKRLENALSEFLGIPILPFDEIVNGKYDGAMQISADPSNRVIITFKLIPELVEVGPQLRVSRLVWEITG